MRRIFPAALVLGLLVPGAGAAMADEHRRPHARERADERASVTLIGRGYGHGHGLSQYGAHNRARHGHGYQRILRFYYSGLPMGRSAGKVKVLITGDTTSDVVVRARDGLAARMVGGKRWLNLERARPSATKWRLVPRAGRTRLEFRTRAGWRRHTAFGGPAEFMAGGKPIALKVSGGFTAYRGALRAVRNDTVNVLPLDKYLLGVVPLEVPALWHAQAVRAQAVAARTYAAFERAAAPRSRHYQICDTSSCQVYGGFSAEHPASNRAVAGTAGQVLLAGGKPAFTQFSASNGGWMSQGSVAYLRARQDTFDPWAGNPYRSWRVTLTGAQVERAYPGIGMLTGISVTARDGDGAWGGRATKVRISGTGGATTVSGDTFRSVFGLRSTYFTTG